LTESERKVAITALNDLNAITTACDDEVEDADKLTLLTKLFLAKPSAAMTGFGTAARGESYMIALEGLPVWAIEDAIKRWYRGDVSGTPQEDFKWAPDSAVLRRIANDVMQPYRDRAKDVQRVLDAKPLDEVYK